MTEENKSDVKFTELDKKLYELQALFDLSKALNSSLNLRTILDTILLTPMGKFLISKGVVLLAEQQHTLVIETLKGLPKELVGKKIEFDALPVTPTLLVDGIASSWQLFLKKHSIDIIIPILHDEKSLGLIGFGKKILGTEYTDSELEYLHSLSNIAATAVQNGLFVKELKDVNRQLDKRVQELNTLFEIGKELNSTLESEKVVNLLAYSIMGEMMVNKCLIYLEQENEMRLALGRGFILDKDDHAIQDQSIFAKLRELSEPYYTNLKDSDGFSKQLQDIGISVLIPMRIQNETKGVVALGDKISKADFLPEELAFLSTLGNLSMITIENARLFEETLEKQRLEKELLIAREIQEGLLPDSCPEIQCFDVAAINLSSLQVGGDYYDVVKLDEHRYAFCIADVSGKGAPAALLMSNLQASFHALLTVDPEITEIARKINNLIYRNTSFDKYITCFFGVLNVKTRQFQSVNAGHNPPYLFHADKSFDLLMEGGLILGMMPDVIYDSEVSDLRTGDCILMYTDGVNETMNTGNEEFGEERIVECVVNNYNSSADAIMNALICSLKSFSENTPQSDDITIVTAKVL